MHMATRIRPDVPILFLETGFHFDETLEFERGLGALRPESRGAHRRVHVGSQAAAFGPRCTSATRTAAARSTRSSPDASTRSAASRAARRSIPVSGRPRGRTRPSSTATSSSRETGSSRRIRSRRGRGAAARRDLKEPTTSRTSRCTISARLDRVRTVHAAAVPRRARTRRPVGRAAEVGVRDPGARGALPELLGDAQGLGRQVDLEATLVAERVAVHLDREQRLRGNDDVARVCMKSMSRPCTCRAAEHLPRDPRHCAAGELAHRRDVQPRVEGGLEVIRIGRSL